MEHRSAVSVQPGGAQRAGHVGQWQRQRPLRILLICHRQAQVCPQGLGHFITCSRESQQEVSRLRKGFSLDYWKAWKARDHRVALHKECNKEHPEKAGAAGWPHTKVPPAATLQSFVLGRSELEGSGMAVLLTLAPALQPNSEGHLSRGEDGGSGKGKLPS